MTAATSSAGTRIRRRRTSPIARQSFRHVKSVLETRPIYHKCDETIRGHVFCSFLALILLKELLERLKRCA